MMMDNGDEGFNSDEEAARLVNNPEREQIAYAENEENEGNENKLVSNNRPEQEEQDLQKD